MGSKMLKQIAELNTLAVAELEARWRKLFGAAPSAHQRRFMVKRLAYRVQELAHGGLSPSALADTEAILDDAACDKLGRIPRRRNGSPGHRRLLIGTRR